MLKGIYLRTEEVRKKQRVAMKGKTYPHTKEHNLKVSLALRGKNKSESHREKVKEARKHQIIKKGNKSPLWKGGYNSCIDCNKKLVVRINRDVRCRDCYKNFNIGKNHHSWKGGYASVYPREFNAELKLRIRTRDNFLCCLCGRTERQELEELNRVLCVNHIDFVKNNCNESNLNTLCLRCNVKINRERDYWTNYFNNLR